MGNNGVFDYDADLYVARSQIEGEIQSWLGNRSKSAHLLSIVGAPGVGKTWFLNSFYEREKRDRTGGVFYLHASQLLSLRIDNFEAITCEDRFHFDSDQALVAHVEAIVSYICSCYAHEDTLIFIDGLDEISLELEKQIEKKVLMPMVRFSESCFRIIITRRYRLNLDYLRERDTRIDMSVFKNAAGDVNLPSQADQQLRKLYSRYPKINQLKADITDRIGARAYLWNHPFINHFLIDRLNDKIEEDEINACINSGEIRECCLALINRPSEFDHEPTRTLIFEDGNLDQLKILSSQLEGSWTDGDSRVDIDDADLIKYIKMNIVYRDVSSYSIADGLRELLRDLDRLEKEENEA